MKTKTLFFALAVAAIFTFFSCKKKNNPPKKEELLQQEDATSAEITRIQYFRPYTSKDYNTLDAIAFKGNIKTILFYDSLHQRRRRYSSFNKDGYLTIDSFYKSSQDDQFTLQTALKITYDENNFIVSEVKKTTEFNNDSDSIHYTVSDGENIIVERWLFKNNQWEPNTKHSYTYYSKGKEATDTFFSYNPRTQIFEKLSVLVTEYNNGNKIDQIEYRFPQITANVGNPDIRASYEYDAVGNLKLTRHFLHNGTEWEANNTSFYTITYW